MLHVEKGLRQTTYVPHQDKGFSTVLMPYTYSMRAKDKPISDVHLHIAQWSGKTSFSAPYGFQRSMSDPLGRIEGSMPGTINYITFML